MTLLHVAFALQENVIHLRHCETLSYDVMHLNTLQNIVMHYSTSQCVKFNIVLGYITIKHISIYWWVSSCAYYNKSESKSNSATELY